MFQSSPHTGVQLCHEKTSSKLSALMGLDTGWVGKSQGFCVNSETGVLLQARAGAWQRRRGALHSFALVFLNTQLREFPHAWVLAQLRAQPAAGAQ